MTARTSILCNSNINPLKTREMKKLILMMGVVFGALTLTNCTNDIDEGLKPEAQTKDFALTVLAGDNTRTSIDDFTTSWTAGDQINVFYAEPATKKYVNSNNFTISAANLASKTFTGKVPVEFDEAANYDWYAVYPYNAALATPANGNTTMVVGQAAQTQSGYNSTAHISGANAPLVGKVKNTNTPAITMSHLVSVMELNVTNASTEVFTIQSVKVESEQNIAGEYAVYVGGDVVVYGDKGGASKSVTLTVNGGTELAAAAAAKLYVAVKPFEAKAGETMKFTITTDKGDVVIEKGLVSDLNFQAGKVKKIALKANRTKLNFDKTVAAVGSDRIYADMDNAHKFWTLHAKEEYDWVSPNKWESEWENPFRENITFTALKNTTGLTRTAYYYVVDVDGTYLCDIKITQAGAPAKMNPSDYEFLYTMIKDGHITYDDGSPFRTHGNLIPGTEAFANCDFDGWLGDSGITVQNVDGVYYITDMKHPNVNEVTPPGEDASVKKKVVINSFPEKMHLPKLKRFHYDGFKMPGVTLPQDWYTPELEKFNVQWSYVGGEIPAGLAATPKLKYIKAYNCDFYGALPHNWESDQLICVDFAENTDLGYMVPASLDVVTPENFVALDYINAPTFRLAAWQYAKWVGFEEGWGQARCAEDQTNPKEWYDNRRVNDALKYVDEADGNKVKVNVNGSILLWSDTYNIDGHLPHVMNEWNQVEADAYTEQCRVNRGLK